MSGATPIRTPLSARQAEALAALLAFCLTGEAYPTPNETAALREVAEKLATLRESR